MSDPVAWLIEYTDSSGATQRAVHLHNAVGDYRALFADAKATPLYEAPRSGAEK